MKDPYEVLGISRNASDDEVKTAYRDLSRKYHPDNYQDNPLANLAEDKFKEVQEAYEAIMNERKNPYSQGFYGTAGDGFGSGNSGYGQDQNSYFRRNGRYDYNRNNPYGYDRGYNNGSDCGTLCCDLWCADSLCECMGGDLIPCC